MSKVRWISMFAMTTLVAVVVGCSNAPESKDKKDGASTTTSKATEKSTEIAKPEELDDLVPAPPRRPGEPRSEPTVEKKSEPKAAAK